MSAPPTSGDYTGHALVDVGLAGLCALSGRSLPTELHDADLDAGGDFIAEHYFTGALDPYLSVVFTNNSGYAGPNRAKRPGDYAEVFRPHRVPPRKHLSAALPGSACAFCAAPAHAGVHRQHVPLFSAAGVLNFLPGGQGELRVCARCLLVVQFAPMAGRRANGKMLAVHTDDARLMLTFAARYLEDNRRLLRLALPSERAPVHPAFEREQPMWDPTNKRYKMADAKGPRSLVLADLTDIAVRTAPSDRHPRPAGLHVYLLSNSGQGPSLECLPVPSGVVAFVRCASEASTRAAWQAITVRFRPLSGVVEQDADPRARRRAARGVSVAGRPGWSANLAFEDLCKVFEGGFVDRPSARAWLARHVLGRIERHAGDVRFADTQARQWALAALFLTEVMSMKAARIDAIKHFADKLAQHIHSQHDRRLFRALAYAAKPYELRQALLAGQRESAGRALLFGLDEYATVWLHEDGDEYLVRDLVCLRVVEQLATAGYFAAHPEEQLEAPGEDDDPREHDEEGA